MRALYYQDRRGFDGLDVELAAGDVTKRRSLVTAFRNADVVYHLAGEVAVAGATLIRSKAVNVIGTRNVVSACLECGVDRLVHVSSCQALSEKPLRWPIDDTRPLADTRRAAVYESIRDLDFELQMGKLTADDHSEVRAELLREAADVLKQIDELGDDELGRWIERAFSLLKTVPIIRVYRLTSASWTLPQLLRVDPQRTIETTGTVFPGNCRR